MDKAHLVTIFLRSVTVKWIVGISLICYSQKMKQTVKEKVVELKEKKGLSFTEIGRILGFTRQRAHQIYHQKT